MDNKIPYRLPYRSKIFIGKSNIHGFGIIARKDIKKNEIVFIIKGKIVHWTVSDEKSALYGSNWIGIGKDTWIDPIHYGIYLNHSSNPSCGIRGKVTLCAMRDIKAGEEITIDYAITEEQELWFMKNSERGCDNHVKSIQSLSRDKFNSYLPFIPTYFKKVYITYHKLNEK